MYGICVLLGISLASLWGERLVKKEVLDLQEYWKAIFYALIFGIVGARLYHVIHRFDYFIKSPWEIVFIWQGGFGIWGAITGGILGIFIALKSTGKLFSYLDVISVCAPLAQGIGRFGNYFNKELFGYPSNLPWAIHIPQPLRPEVYKYYDRFHPLFLYESVLDLILFVTLYRVYKKKTGNVFVFYLLGYALIRLVLEFLRPEPWRIVNVPVSVIFSILTVLVAVYLKIKILRFSS